MANRYGRDIGRRDREGFENEDRGSGRYSSSGYGSTPFGEDESYFGGSRQFGEGYSGDSPRNFETYGGGGFGQSMSDRSDRGYSEGRGERGSGRYRQGRESSQGYGRESGGRFSGGSYGEYSGGGYSRDDYSDRSGYESGRSNYGGYGGSRSDNRYSSPRSEGYGRYGSNYPSSERGYWGSDESGNERGWWDKTSDEVASWLGDEDAAQRRQRDMRSGGGHRGRGPTGYTRSDDRIREDINDRLTDYDYIDATNISVEVQGGDVILTGTVNSRYEKRLAEDITDDISGVKNVENRLRVNTAQNYGQGSSAYSTGSEISSGMSGSATETTTGSTATSTGTQAKGKSSSGS